MDVTRPGIRLTETWFVLSHLFCKELNTIVNYIQVIYETLKTETNNEQKQAKVVFSVRGPSSKILDSMPSSIRMPWYFYL